MSKNLLCENPSIVHKFTPMLGEERPDKRVRDVLDQS